MASAGDFNRNFYFPRTPNYAGIDELLVLDEGQIRYGIHPYVIRVRKTGKIFLVTSKEDGREDSPGIPIEKTYWDGDHLVWWRGGRLMFSIRHKAYEALCRWAEEGEEWVLAWKKD